MFVGLLCRLKGSTAAALAVRMLSRTRALCFAGSGCLATYQFGVAQCLLKHGQPLMATISHVVGCSGGSLVAAVLVKAPGRLEDAVQLSLQCKNQTAVERVLEESAFETQEADAPKLVISAATATRPIHEVHFEGFNNRGALLNCLRASCHIPRDFHPLDALSPFPASYKDAVSYEGKRLMDGGFAAALPKIPNADNIFVSAMSGPGVHICPQARGTARWFSKKLSGQRFHVNTENIRRFGISIVGGPPLLMEEYLHEGFRDCEKFLRQENLFQE